MSNGYAVARGLTANVMRHRSTRARHGKYIPMESKSTQTFPQSYFTNIIIFPKNLNIEPPGRISKRTELCSGLFPADFQGQATVVYPDWDYKEG